MPVFFFLFSRKDDYQCRVSQQSVQITEDSYYILEDLHKHAEVDWDTVLFVAGHSDMFCLLFRLDEFV